MKKILLLLLVIFTATAGNAQQVKNEKRLRPQFSESAPEYPGGIKAFYEYIHTSLKGDVIPQGRMIISFLIKNDGSLDDIEIKQGIEPGFNKRMIEVFRKSPKWRPGYQQNKPLDVRMTLPIKFS